MSKDKGRYDVEEGKWHLLGEFGPSHDKAEITDKATGEKYEGHGNSKEGALDKAWEKVREDKD